MPNDPHEERRRELAAMLDQLQAILAQMDARVQTPLAMPQRLDRCLASMDPLIQEQEARIARFDAMIARFDARRARQARDKDNRRDACPGEGRDDAAV